MIRVPYFYDFGELALRKSSFGKRHRSQKTCASPQREGKPRPFQAPQLSGDGPFLVLIEGGRSKSTLSPS